MTAAPDPREVSALLRYASLDYFGAMRDAFADAAGAAEDALAALAGGPARRLPDADAAAIWTHCVLPNLRWTLAGLDAGYAALAHGRAEGYGAAANVRTALAAIAREHGSGWMDEAPRARFAAASTRAWRMATDVHRTVHGDWAAGELARRWHDADRGLLAGAAAWSAYRANPAVRVASGEPVPAGAVYLPEGDAGPRYLVAGRPAPGLPRVATGGARPERAVATVWTLVERVAVAAPPAAL